MNESSNIRIFIVDDHIMFVEGLVVLLSSESDFEFVGKASSIAETKRSLGSVNPNIVILDVDLPDGEGYSIHEWLTETYGSTTPKVLYVTGNERLASIDRAMSLGAMAYLDKTGGWDELANAIRRADVGLKTLGANIAAIIADYSFNSDSYEYRLSARESEILNGISDGLTAKEISAQMGLALPTIQTYISRLFTKLGAKDRAHAVSIGYVHGLIGS